MNTIDVIILVCVIGFIALILFFNIKSLKSGNKCCNCPYSKQCKEKCNNKKDCFEKQSNHNNKQTK